MRRAGASPHRVPRHPGLPPRGAKRLPGLQGPRRADSARGAHACARAARTDGAGRGLSYDRGHDCRALYPGHRSGLPGGPGQDPGDRAHVGIGGLWRYLRPLPGDRQFCRTHLPPPAGFHLACGGMGARGLLRAAGDGGAGQRHPAGAPDRHLSDRRNHGQLGSHPAADRRIDDRHHRNPQFVRLGDRDRLFGAELARRLTCAWCYRRSIASSSTSCSSSGARTAAIACGWRRPTHPVCSSAPITAS